MDIREQFAILHFCIITVNLLQNFIYLHGIFEAVSKTHMRNPKRNLFFIYVIFSLHNVKVKNVFKQIIIYNFTVFDFEHFKPHIFIDQSDFSRD